MGRGERVGRGLVRLGWTSLPSLGLNRFEKHFKKPWAGPFTHLSLNIIS